MSNMEDARLESHCDQLDAEIIDWAETFLSEEMTKTIKRGIENQGEFFTGVACGLYFATKGCDQIVANYAKHLIETGAQQDEINQTVAAPTDIRLWCSSGLKFVLDIFEAVEELPDDTM